MSRLSKKSDAGTVYVVAEDLVTPVAQGYSGAAIQRLAAYENIVDELAASQLRIAADMERLRNMGRTNSVQFKQLLAEKLMNSNMLVLLHRCETENP